MAKDFITCRIWTARATDLPVDLLLPAERLRWARYRLAADRDRFATGVMLQRRALRQLTGRDIDITRRCPTCGSTDHGPTSAEPPWDRQWSISLAHGGAWVVVAVTPAQAPVGVDIEEVERPLWGAVADIFLTPAELAAHHSAPDARGLAVRWVRKESILKAARVGLMEPMTTFEVGEPDEPAVLRGWRGDPMTITDLDVGPGYVGAVAVAAALPVRVQYQEALYGNRFGSQ